MDKYNLNAKECVFLDDNAANLVYPQLIGWKTVLFQSHAKAQEELDALLQHSF